MATFDEISTSLGPPLHSWRFHSATPQTEADVGSDPDTPFNASDGSFTGRVGGPLLDGTASYAVSFSNGALHRSAGFSSNDFASTTLGSITVFFRSSSATNQQILSAHPDGILFVIWLLAGGQVQLNIVNGSTGTSFTTPVGPNYGDGNWHFLCITTNNSTINKLYIDGADTLTPSFYQGAGLGDHPWLSDIGGGTVLLYVGRSTRHPVQSFPFVGDISRLAFWGFPLSADNVASLYNAAIGLGALPSNTPKTYDDLDLPFTNDVFMAQRLMWRRLVEGQRKRFLSIKMSMRALQWTVGDAVTVTLPDFMIDDETYRIESWTFDREEGLVSLALLEDKESNYFDPLPVQYKAPSVYNEGTAGDLNVPGPENLTAVPALEGIQLRWDPSSFPIGFSHYEIWSSLTNQWSAATIISAQTLATQYLHVLSSTVTRWYWVRAVNSQGATSIRAPNSDTSTVTATYTAGTISAPSAPQSLGGIDGTPATGDLTGSFTRAGVTVASRVFTATHSGGNLTYSAGADTGEATTHSATGSGTPTLVVTHRHTGSGQATTLTFTVAP